MCGRSESVIEQLQMAEAFMYLGVEIVLSKNKEMITSSN